MVLKFYGPQSLVYILILKGGFRQEMLEKYAFFVKAQGKETLFRNIQNTGR